MIYLEIYRPIKSKRVTQRFGENLACYNPVFKITEYKNKECRPGFVDMYKSQGMLGHPGIDIQSYEGEPLYFPIKTPGQWYVVNYEQPSGLKGVQVIDYEKGIRFDFKHLSEQINFSKQDNVLVSCGQLIGYCGKSGTTAPHLHWEMCEVDSNGLVKNMNNGYRGAINIKWWEDVFVLDNLRIKRSWLDLLKDLIKKFI